MRRVLAFSLIAFSLLGSSVAQRATGTTVPPTDLYVRCIVDRGAAAGMGLRVQILSSRGTPVDEGFTNDQGTVTLRLNAGDYSIRVTGPSLEEPAESKFSLMPREPMRTEFVTVKIKSEAQPMSTEGSVSAKALKIPPKARSKFEKGFKAMEDQNLGDARKLFEEAVKIYPEYAEALNAIGVIAMKTGKPEEGRKYFEDAIRADDQNPAAYINMGKIYMNHQQFADAESMIQRALGFKPLDVEALSIVSYCQLSQGKFDAAIATANKVHTLQHPRFGMVHFVAAVAFERRNQTREAIDQYRLYISESPAGPDVERAKTKVQSLEARLTTGPVQQ